MTITTTTDKPTVDPVDPVAAQRALDEAEHDSFCAEFTAEDGIPRLNSAQHRAAFAGPVPTDIALGDQVAAWDSSTLGTVCEIRTTGVMLLFPDIDGNRPIGPYPLTQVRRAANPGMR